MGLFKTKEEKQLELEQRLIELQNQFKDAIDKYHMVNKEVFILKGFKIKDNDINYIYLDKDTPKGYVNSLPYDIFKLRYGINLEKAYYNWIEFKDNLEKLNLKVLYI